MPDRTQIRIADLAGALEQAAKMGRPFEQSEVTFEKPRDDVAFLKEITGNRMLAEGFMMSRGLVNSWNLVEIILRAYVEPVKWKGSDQFRSSIGIPILAENFYSSLSAFQQTLFAGNRPFIVDQGATTSVDTARAQEILLMSQLKIAGPKNTSAKQEMRAVAFDAFLYGTGIALTGFETRTIKKQIVRRKGETKTIAINGSGATIEAHANEDNTETVFEEIEVRQPRFEHVPLRRVRVAPDCRRGDIRSASWRGRIFYLDSYDLKSFRDQVGFNIPTDEELTKLTTPFKTDATNTNVMETQTGGITNANPVQRPAAMGLNKAQPEALTESNQFDPLAKKFEIFEYMTDNRVGWVLENQYMIRNQNHDGDIQMLSFNFRQAPDSFFGYGMGMFFADFQRMAQGVANSFFDDLALYLMGTYTEESGINNQAQPLWIFPGKVAPKGILPMQGRQGPKIEALSVMDTIKTWAANITGAGASIQGQNPGRPGDMRTKQGVEALTGGDAMKMQDLIDQACELVFVPLLEFMIEQNRKLKPSQIRSMLTEELGAAFTGDPIDILNGSYKVSISAGAKLNARTALNQSLGYIQTVLQQPGLTDQLGVQGVKIDYKSMFQSIMESFGFPYIDQWVVPMTDEDKQRLKEQQNGPSQQLQSKLTVVDAQGEKKKQVDDNQAENRALLHTQEHMFQHNMESAFGGKG